MSKSNHSDLFHLFRTEGKKIAWSGIAQFVISAQFRRWSRKRAVGGNQTKKQKRFSWVYFMSYFFLIKKKLCQRTESGMLLAPIKSFRVCISHQSDHRIRVCISHQSERRFCLRGVQISTKIWGIRGERFVNWNHLLE